MVNKVKMPKDSMSRLFPFWELVLYLAAVGSVFYLIQSASQFLVGFDGYFHIKFSHILAQEKFINTLPWLQYTIHKASFVDHHLLWHYLLIPFTFGDLILGGQVATMVSFILVSVLLYFLLRQTGVRQPALWGIATLLSSHAFLYRMSLLRVQSISLALLLLMFLFCLKKRYLWVCLLTIFYVWLYDGYPLLFFIALVFCLARYLLEAKADYKIVGVCILGILTGMVCNPYFPGNVSSLFYNASRSLFLDVPGMSLGSEWNPYNTWAFLKNSLPAFLALFAIMLRVGFRERLKVEEFAALLLNVFFFILTLKSRRFIEYWPVFAVLSAALLFGRDKIPGRFIVIGFMLISPLLTYNVKEAYREVGQTPDPLVYRGASAWLKVNSQPGEIVFNADWDDFPFLFFYNSSNYYVVGLDPMYLFTFDQEKSKRYKAITRGKIKMPAGPIRDEFNCRFVFLDKQHNALYKNLQEDPQAKMVYEDEGSYVFEIIRGGWK